MKRLRVWPVPQAQKVAIVSGSSQFPLWCIMLDLWAPSATSKSNSQAPKGGGYFTRFLATLECKVAYLTELHIAEYTLLVYPTPQ